MTQNTFCITINTVEQTVELQGIWDANIFQTITGFVPQMTAIYLQL